MLAKRAVSILTNVVEETPCQSNINKIVQETNGLFLSIKSIVLKIEPDQSAQPKTSHSPNIVSIKDLIAFSMKSILVEPASSWSNRETQLNR